MPDYVAEELEKADAARSDASVLLEGGASDEAIVNRLYYACFHAATAALYAAGEEPTSHRGTLALFGSELVVDGPATRDDGRCFNRLRDYREQADHGYDPIDANVDALIERTDDFVETMREIIDERQGDE